MRIAICLVVAGGVINGAAAHEHHNEDIPEGSVVSPDPLDSILWLHIAGMILSFGECLFTGEGLRFCGGR